GPALGQRPQPRPFPGRHHDREHLPAAEAERAKRDEADDPLDDPELPANLPLEHAELSARRARRRPRAFARSVPRERHRLDEALRASAAPPGVAAVPFAPNAWLCL